MSDTDFRPAVMEPYMGRPQRRAEDRNAREALLPVWARGLSTRAQQLLLNELQSGWAPDLTIATMRRMGEQMWRRVPGLGKVSADEIGRAIGGWK